MATTVVFADLVDSTGLYQQLGDDAASRFVTHLTGLLSQVFQQHQGRVVKLLGDGLFVVFASPGQALAACISVQKRLQDTPIYPAGRSSAAYLQIGMDSGEVVEIEGDCFGDTVNCAARLADLAGAGQILATQSVWAALLPLQRSALRSMGEMFLRGRVDASHVYRIDWQTGRDDDATLVGRSMLSQSQTTCLELGHAGRVVRLDAKSGPVSLGRAANASLAVNDPRVSRMHASVVWRSGQFVLLDASSYGTWVYMGNQSQALILRRTECCLVGNGHIVLGCEKEDERGKDNKAMHAAPLVAFSTKNMNASAGAPPIRNIM